ncbi:hypothetical protein X925_01505 [Petrotoga sp. 9T1HF07.CasAA.8.2]|nr:hypothetical protein X925_01505 [Petrotoga sp. 9T1HF07.CasAA.8.2]
MGFKGEALPSAGRGNRRSLPQMGDLRGEMALIKTLFLTGGERGGRALINKE